MKGFSVHAVGRLAIRIGGVIIGVTGRGWRMSAPIMRTPGAAGVVAAVLASGFAVAAVSPSVRAAGQPAASSLPCPTWDPAWSPDGLRIAFGVSGSESIDPTGNTGGRIESVDPAGTTVQVLTQPPTRSQLTDL